MKQEMLRYSANILPVVFVLWLASLVRELPAQDPQFSQFFATRIYVNPAFTGNTNFSRISTQFRRQWPSLEGYTTTGIYYDQNLHGINSGIGLSMIADRQSSGALAFNQYSAMYSYKFPVARKVAARFGLAASYSTFNIDLSHFVFNDQLLSGTRSTMDDYRFSKISFIDFNTGMVVYTDMYWLGGSIANLNNIHTLGTVINPHPIKYSIHGGGIIPINKNIKGIFSKSFSVAAHYKAQQDYDQFDFGSYYRVSNFLIGLWYRGLFQLKDNETTQPNMDAVIIVIGMAFDAMRLSYSYDISTSKLNGYSGGAHEIAMQIELWKNIKHRKKKFSQLEIPCPNFGGPGWQLGTDD